VGNGEWGTGNRKQKPCGIESNKIIKNQNHKTTKEKNNPILAKKRER